HDRHRAGEVQDRDDEPRLQHPPAGSARADGGCARLSALTGGLRVASCIKDRAVVRQASPIGDSPWHERSNCSLKSRNRRKRILFEVPTSQKSVVLENLDAAIAKVSDNGKFRFNPRQLLYVLRPIVKEERDEELKVA